MVQRKLGRGLDFLLSGGERTKPEDEIAHLELSSILPNPFQPRREFEAAELEELAASILEHGVLQPILVRRVSDGYQIIAGERRFRASQRLGLPTVPAVVRSASDTQMLEIALVENIQRSDLNPIEEALAYAAYIQRLDLTQEQAAQRLGKSRPAIANSLRLLDLPGDLQELVSRGTLAMGHARALLGVADITAQRELARRAVDQGWSVRQVEAAVRERGTPPREPRAEAEEPSEGPAPGNAHLEDLESRLKQRLGTRVSLRDRGGRGRIVVEYFSREELDRLLELLLGAPAYE